MSGGNIKVVVRCRPLNSRELARGAKGLIQMDGNQTILNPPETVGVSAKSIEKKPFTFSFDKSYWSAGPKDEPQYASQQNLYEDLGAELLDHSFEGFNTCIFAYGQTGSGKSYSMMGYGVEKGIIPLTTSELFRRVEERTSQDPNLSYTVEVSYIEIYNEKVRDLLNPKNKGNLRVREHPSLGPYVEDLSRLVVENYGQMMTLMDEGNKARTVASTNMNETSSRSHAVFTLILTQKRLDSQTKITGEKVSKISLVDLAGSERQASTGATGTRLKEGANINKSLTTLGKVIAALAQAGQHKKKKEDHVPYRDSVLTWLLKESLGGNSKTAMIAAISPADYEETLSTLRYADAAKKIKTHAVVNEDPNAKLIRELKEELDMLRSRVSTGNVGDESLFDPLTPPEKQFVTFKTKDGEIRKVTKLELQDQLQASEKLMESLNLTWEEKLQKTQTIHIEREKALEELGISIDKNMVGVHAPQNHPSLVNLNEDPLMSECLVYQLKPGTTITGSLDGDNAHIKLSGTHILSEHCVFTNEDGVVTIEAMPDARTFVNGKRVPPVSPVKLFNGFRVILGDSHVFRFNDPASVRAERQKLRGSASLEGLAGIASGFRPDSPSSRVDELMDWTAARREVADIEKLGDHDLDRLYDDILKVRTLRKRPESGKDPGELESHMDRTADPSSTSRAGPGGRTSTMTSNSLGTPVYPDIDVNLADGQSEDSTEQPLDTSPASPSAGYDQKAADAKIHQEHLTKQLRTMAQEVKRIRSQAAKARAMEEVDIEPASWGVDDLRKIRWVVDRWRRLRWFKMAEEILLGAVDVREANVIAAHMGKSVTYNFLVVDGTLASPVSCLDETNGVVEFEDVSASQHSNAPAVVVKVLDWQAKAVYTWDLSTFKQQLNKMRHVSALKEKPNYSVHFQVDGPFTDSPPPSYSFCGSCKVPLRLLASRLSYTVTVPIMCPYTMEAIGSCRVKFQCAESNAALSGVAPDSSRPLSDSRLALGSQCVFTITVDAIKGLSSTDYTSIHAQTRLSSLVGPSVISDDTFTSKPVNLDTSGSLVVLKGTVSVVVTPEVLAFFENEYGAIAFFAEVKDEYLSRLARWDVKHESGFGMSTAAARTKGGVGPGMRRCETEFASASAERHDVLATVSILELASNGDYVASSVTDDVFQLHQGLQRRLRIQLRHSSGRAFPWETVEHVGTGDIRVADKNGIASVKRPQVEMRLTDQRVGYHADGTASFDVEGVWDTAAHACRQLDRRTPSGQRILVRLTWILAVPTLSEPASFHLDLPLKIVDRDARRSSLLAIFGNTPSHTSLTRVYSVECCPPLARSADELWRLDTGEKHVNGEEALGEWRPRSLGLLCDYERMTRAQTGLGDVAVTRAVLGMLGDGVDARGEAGEGEQRLEKKYLGLWENAMAHRVRLDFERQSIQEETVSRKLRRLLPEIDPKPIPIVNLQPLVENVIKSGYLVFLRDSGSDQWERVYVVLRRPYLHVHASAGQREMQVINLIDSHVTSSAEVEMLLKRAWAFTIFTPTNSFIIQAGSEKERREWMAVMSTRQ